MSASAAEYPLRVSESRRYLETSGGKPFLVVGDTAWSLIAQLSEKDAVEYLVDRKAASSWRAALDLPGSRDMARLGALLRQYPWHRLVPDLDALLVTAGGGADVAKVTAASTQDGKLAMLYIPSQRSETGDQIRELTLDLTRFAGPVRGRWFNPARDEKGTPLDSALKSAKLQVVRTPGDNGTGTSDWVLILESR